MTRIAVVTDSAACVPPDLVRKYGIHVVPFELVWDGRSYRDGLDITPAEVYRRLRELREGNSWPTTSQPALGAFATLYAELSQRADGIVSIHVPDELSGTLHTAQLAAEQAASVPVRVIDARTAAIAEGFVVLAAARAAAEGKSLDEVAAAAEAAIPRVGLFATLASLEYLHRGGRIGEAAAMLGTRLRIHPILYLAEGRVKVAGVVRNRRQALERILDLMEERVGKRPMCAAVFHADAGDDAAWIEGQVRQRFDCQQFYVTEFTPVMGVHTGPGTIGLAFCARDESEPNTCREETMATEEQIREALRPVMDPEIGMSVVDLGMIREVIVEGDQVEIKMVLTAPFCPLANFITEQVRLAAEGVPGVREAKVTLLRERWDPSWMQK